jgi:hypothetical protein
MEESTPDIYYLGFINDTLSSVNSPLNGTWVSSLNETYIINSSTLEYDSGFEDSNFSGYIRETVWFTSTFGVIIIEYINKPIDWLTGLPTPGNFSGISFRDLTSNTVELCIAVSDGKTASTTTLTEARLMFTEGSFSDFFIRLPPCTRQ